MPLASLLHQPKALRAIRSALSSDRVPHGWMFTGPEGVGKELAAIGLAQALVCTEEPRVGCGTCAACRKVQSGNHPDVVQVEAEGRQREGGAGPRRGAASRDIRVDQVRLLQERLVLRPLEASARVAIILGADAMNPAAQNSLLKFLEEPPPATSLVLVTDAPDRLLPTIRSRVARATFAPLPAPFILVQVSAAGMTSAEAATRLAQGSLGRALAFDEASLAMRSELIRAYAAVEASETRGWLVLAERASEDRQHAAILLDALDSWHRDIAIQQVDPSLPIVNVGLELPMGPMVAAIDPFSLHRRCELVAQARNAIFQRNGMVRLQLERMFAGIFSADLS